MTTYRHLFFDLDHTLWDFDTNAKEALQDVYQELNLHQQGIDDFDFFYKRYIEHNAVLWDRYHKGFITSEELKWKRMWRTLLEFKIGSEPLAKSMSDAFLHILPSKRNLFPHTHELLTYLQNKSYRMHLITNGFEKTQHSKLKHSGLHIYFQEVITSERSNFVKPQKEIFDYALQITGASLAESVMIGDNPEADILGAVNAGMDSVYVNHINNETIPEGATYTIRHLRELEALF
jgi:putative hydrolase of the HAD superfamily